MRFPIIESIYIFVSQGLPWPHFSSKIAHYQERKGEKINQNGQISLYGQIREFIWPTTIRTEILREFLHKILKGISVYKGRLLYPGTGACAYKRGTFLISNFTNR